MERQGTLKSLIDFTGGIRVADPEIASLRVVRTRTDS